MQWEVADESVVVSKSRPLKPGNGVEDKTGMTRDRVCGAPGGQKPPGGCEGRKSVQRSWKIMKVCLSGHKPSDGMGHGAVGRP
jgi:hypothetical protein